MSLKIIEEPKINISTEAGIPLAFVNPDMSYYADGWDLSWTIAGWIFPPFSTPVYVGEDGGTPCGECVVPDSTQICCVQYINLDTDKQYRISFSGKIKEADFDPLNTYIAINEFITLTGLASKYLNEIAQGGDGTTWEEYSIDFTTITTGPHNVRFVLYNNSGGNSTIKLKGWTIEEI